MGDEGREIESEQHIVVRRRGHSHPKLVHPLSLRVEGARARDAGALDQSGRLLERALCLAPDNARCLTSYGQTLAGKGRLEDSLICFQRAIAADSNDTHARHEMGRVLRTLGRHPEAVSCYQGILRIHPADVTARIGLGLALRGMGRLQDAVSAFKTATKQAPSDSEPWAELARTWREMGRLRKANQAGTRAVRLGPRSANAWLVQGWNCLALDLLDQAAESFRAAELIDKENDEAKAGLASIRIRDGDLEGAAEMLEALVANTICSPRVATAFATLCVRQQRAPEAISLLQRVMTQPLAASDKIRLAFALGELWEAIGEHEAALRAWEGANELVYRGTWKNTFEPEVKAVMQTWTPRFGDALPRSRVRGEELVFIVGFPRSGINLVETILAAHPAVYPTGRSPDLAQMVERLPLQLGSRWPECMGRFQHISPDALSKKLLNEWRRNAGDVQRICVSDPLNFRYLGLISFLYPGARFIHVQRNPQDVLLSCFAQPFVGKSHSFTGTLQGLADYWNCYQKLMQHWRAVLPISILEIQYEDLVRKPAEEVQRLGRFVELRGTDVLDTFFNVPPRFGAPAPLEPPRPLDAQRVGRASAFDQWLGPVRQP